jgi:hypothetical protein
MSTKISAKPDIVTLAAADKLVVADASDLTASKSATMTEVNAYLRTLPLGPAEITALPAASALAFAHTFPVNQSGTAGEATLTQLWQLLFASGFPWVIHLGSNYTTGSTTGSEITGLSFTGISAGTYLARWTLFSQSNSATTTSSKFGVNYTGTVTRMMNMAQFPSAGVNAATGTMIDVANATTGQILAYANSTTASSTAPNLGPWVGVTTQNVNHRVVIESLIVVADSGDLELWAGSEVGGSQIAVVAGSCGTLIRMA